MGDEVANISVTYLKPQQPQSLTWQVKVASFPAKSMQPYSVMVCGEVPSSEVAIT